MSFPNQHNPYNFNAFLEWRNQVNFYTDDAFLQKVLKHFSEDAWEESDSEARNISEKVSYRWRDFANAIAAPEKRPYMMHYDGHHNRIDRIVRPHEVEIMEKEVFGEKLFSDDFSPWVKLIKMMLIYQNGESCIACPVTCTEGLVELLNEFAETLETKHILQHCKEGIDGDFGIGAQYISEIQGGSDIPANMLEAVKDGDIWRLYGSKFFCSATHADYVVVTAKPKNTETVALFVVPSWLPGNKEKEIRNGYTIDRIKEKMGTKELTTGELTFHGAIAYPVGPMNKGLSNVVAIVLTYSRLTVGLSAAAYMSRAVREAQKYSEFREAFGTAIGKFPLVKMQLREMELFRRRTTAGAFKLYHEFLDMNENADQNDSLEYQKKKLRVRELVMLQKITATWDSTDVIRKAMSIFGGYGVMEDFSALPRLYRDSAINEQWEGPRNVLLTQIYRDLRKASSWYKPKDFIYDLIPGASSSIKEHYSLELAQYLSHGSLLKPDEATIEICQKWDEFCHRLFHTYQDCALAEVG
ncbi:MAG: acyl-CoA dehydrogenase family protein [Bacteroidetes bacterium]|nr:acyl-CoA dehydrogenase family protein [Bacteroidota bacterium]